MAEQELKLSDHFIRTLIATAGSHQGRLLLNAITRTPFLKEAVSVVVQNPFKGIGINVVRGSIATGSQSYLYNLQANSNIAIRAATAACSGTFIATFIETPFIRYSTPEFAKAHVPLSRYNIQLIWFYFLREFGFSLAVLTKKDCTPITQYSLLIIGAWVTAMGHKFAALKAIEDTLPQGVTIPNFNQGIGYTLRSMAEGNVYTHPVFKVTHKDPKTLTKKVLNLGQVTCGKNMFGCRLLFLVLFREAYDLAATIQDGYANFFNHSKPSKSLAHEIVQELPRQQRP